MSQWAFVVGDSGRDCNSLKSMYIITESYLPRESISSIDNIIIFILNNLYIYIFTYFKSKIKKVELEINLQFQFIFRNIIHIIHIYNLYKCDFSCNFSYGIIERSTEDSLHCSRIYSCSHLKVVHCNHLKQSYLVI